MPEAGAVAGEPAETVADRKDGGRGGTRRADGVGAPTDRPGDWMVERALRRADGYGLLVGVTLALMGSVIVAGLGRIATDAYPRRA